MPRTAFLLTSPAGSSVCAYVATEQEARDLAAAKGHAVAAVDTLPYPSRPRLDDAEGWGPGQIPSFCYRPEACKGKTACPQRRSCTE